MAVEEVATPVSEPAPVETASEDEMPPSKNLNLNHNAAPKEEVAAPQQSNDEEEEEEEEDYNAPTDEEADCVPREFSTTYFVDEENDVMTQDGDVELKRKKVGDKYILKRN